MVFFFRLILLILPSSYAKGPNCPTCTGHALQDLAYTQNPPKLSFTTEPFRHIVSYPCNIRFLNVRVFFVRNLLCYFYILFYVLGVTSHHKTIYNAPVLTSLNSGHDQIDSRRTVRFSFIFNAIRSIPCEQIHHNYFVLF